MSESDLAALRRRSQRLRVAIRAQSATVSKLEALLAERNGTARLPWYWYVAVLLHVSYTLQTYCDMTAGGGRGILFFGNALLFVLLWRGLYVSKPRGTGIYPGTYVASAVLLGVTMLR